MMKNFMLFLSHTLNLILVAAIALTSGVAIGYYNIGGIGDAIYAQNAEAIDKKKEKKTKKKDTVKMGFHI